MVIEGEVLDMSSELIRVVRPFAAQVIYLEMTIMTLLFIESKNNMRKKT